MKILIINQPLTEFVKDSYELVIALTVSESNIKSYYRGKYIIITDTGVIYKADALTKLGNRLVTFKLNGLEMYIVKNTVYSQLKEALFEVVSSLVIESLKDNNISLGGGIQSPTGKDTLLNKTFVITYNHKGEDITLELNDLRELAYTLSDCFISRSQIKALSVTK